MIQLNNQGIYQIKHLVNNPVNTNKFIYIDSVDGNLTIKQNKWFLDLNYYVIDNANLPPNIFSAFLELPFADVKDISLSYVASAKIPDWIVQKDSCKVYKTSFSIDTNESKFFEQVLTEYLMYLEFSFDVNSDVINDSNIDVSQSDLDGFISEWNLIHETLSFDFSNYMIFEDDNGSFESGSQYYLNSKTGYVANENTIFYQTNDNLNNKITPIKNLITLDCIQPFWINKITTKFYYSFDDSPGIKTYESSDDNRIYVYQKQDISFNEKTMYDQSKNEIIPSLNGIEGFYIPKKASGYFEILISITQNENTRIYCFKKEFDFIGDEYESQIQIKQILINDLTNFERMEF